MGFEGQAQMFQREKSSIRNRVRAIQIIFWQKKKHGYMATFFLVLDLD